MGSSYKKVTVVNYQKNQVLSPVIPFKRHFSDYFNY